MPGTAHHGMHTVFLFFFSLQRYGLCFQCLRLSYCVFCLLSNFSDCNCLQTPTLTLLPGGQGSQAFLSGEDICKRKGAGCVLPFHKAPVRFSLARAGQNPFPHPVGPEFDKLRDLILIFQLTLSVKSCPLGH